MRQHFVLPVFFLTLLVPSSASAALTDAQIQAIVGLLTSFGADASVISNVSASLKGQPVVVSTTTPPTTIPTVTPTTNVTFTRDLQLGMTGEDVRALQKILNKSGDTQVALTGTGSRGYESDYFGARTQLAVIAFQKKYTIAPAAGYVGKITRAKLLEVSSGTTPPNSPVITPPNTTTLTNTSTTTSTGTTTSSTGTGGAGGTTSSGGGGGGGSTPDTTAPSISSVASGSITTTAATITWTTNESSNSKVTYATNSGLTGAVFSLNASNVTSHSIALSGLSSNTTYYYAVTSKDASNNSATSSTASFTTGNPADTTPPTISSIASSTTATSATVTWTTNELAYGRLIFSLNSSLTPIAGIDTNIVTKTSHSLLAAPISANTVYFFVVVSTDTAGNAATSSLHSFKTAGADTTAPVISNVASGSITSSAATITWTTNEASDGKVTYATNSGLTSPLTTTIGSSATSHSIDLSSLSSNTTYYYVVTSKDGSNNYATSSPVSSFTTSAPDVTAPVISNVRWDDDPIYELHMDEDGTADVGWDTNELTTGKIYFNTSFPVNISTAVVVTNAYSAATDFDTGPPIAEDPDPGYLVINTTYYFIIVATDLAGNAATSSSASYTFTTGGAHDETMPVITNIQVSDITSSTATVSWNITEDSPLEDPPNTLDYGTTSGSLNLSKAPNPVGGSLPNLTHSVSLTGLSSNTTYYFEIHETDRAGNQIDMPEQSFTTSS